jgi:hypothetical protein
MRSHPYGWSFSCVIRATSASNASRATSPPERNRSNSFNAIAAALRIFATRALYLASNSFVSPEFIHHTYFTTILQPFEGWFLAQSHGCQQSLTDPAILWQGVSVFIYPDRPPRFASAHAIDRTMIVASLSEAELDFPNHRVGMSSAALVRRLIVRIV